MSLLTLTSSQTVGPFFSPCLLRQDACRNVLIEPETSGERIRIEGRVLDGDGAPINDALVEIWQANAHGRYNHPADQGAALLEPSFTGFGRSGTDENGSYWFETIKPGCVPFKGEQLQAPHICVTVFARGLLNHAVTRLYFADEPDNIDDPVLQCVPQNRRATLLARREADSEPFLTDGLSAPTMNRGATGRESGVGRLHSEPVVYRFDIVLQGENETVFFNL